MRRLPIIVVACLAAAGCGGASATSSGHSQAQTSPPAATAPARLTAQQVAVKLKAAVPGFSLILNPSHESRQASELQVPESLKSQYDYATVWVFKSNQRASDYDIGKVSVTNHPTHGDWSSYGVGDGTGTCTVNKAYGDYVVLSLLYSGTKQRCGTKTDGAFLTLDQALTTLTGGG